LDHLSDGPSTVTGSSKAVTLRLPHASAELKRMREEGLIQSDSGPGQRGAKQHLTAAGWQVILGDELARLAESRIDSIPEHAIGKLLAKDGPQLLLAYTKSLTSPLIPLPWSGDFSHSEQTVISSGIKGVKAEYVWAVAREAEVRWYDLTSLEQVPPPSEDQSTSSLSDWVEPAPVIGLVRARLLDPRQSLKLAIGSWFGEPGQEGWPDLPMPMGESESWTLGTAHESSSPLQSQCPICAILPDRLSTTTLLSAASNGALVIAEASLLGRQGDAIPLSILDSWINRAHPRLTQTERRHRLQGLIQAIRKGRRKRSGNIRVEESTWRRFQSDWSKHQWIEKSEVENIIIDVQGLSSTAWLSLIDWSLARQETTPVVLQYPPGHHDQDQLHSVFQDPRTRLAILSQEPEEPLAYPTLRPDPIRPLSWYLLKLAGDVELPCKVTHRPPPSFTSPPPLWVPPNSASTLEEVVAAARLAAGDSAPPDASEESSEEMRLFAASLRYPEGDADWADRIESVDPLAAWIACPDDNRWPLWRRQSNQLGADWISLLPVEKVPIEFLAEVAGTAPNEWQVLAHNHLVQRIRDEDDLALRLRTLIDSHHFNDVASSWLTSTLLSQVAWLPLELASDLARWAPNSIAKSLPSNIIPALTGLIWLSSQGELDDNWVRDIEASQRSSPIINGWISLLSTVRDDRSPSVEEIREITSLPIEWWAPFSPLLFNIITEGVDGREMLLGESIPWASALFRKIGEIHTIPGLGEIEHPGCPTDLVSRLERILQGVEIEVELQGFAELTDILNTLKSILVDTKPVVGQIHPMIGWLLQPRERWPAFSATEIVNGDPEVAARLAAGISGYHDGLRESAQRRL
jgi:hypothetical protein